MHLFLSPHLDDAVLSCGGLIDQLVKRGERVVVRTVMAGDPPDPLPDTPVIRDLHGRWAAGDNPYIARRREDREAIERLGAEPEYMDVRDCPYRLNAKGEALYPLNINLFQDMHPDDPVLQTQLDIPPDVTTVYGPLGAGNHVDHQVVAELTRRLPAHLTVYYYEEYPYSASTAEAVRVSGDATVQKHGAAAVQLALSRFPYPMESHVVMLNEENLAAKIAATACYASQISTFWDSLEDLDVKIRQYAQEVAAPAAERLWVKRRGA